MAGVVDGAVVVDGGAIAVVATTVDWVVDRAMTLLGQYPALTRSEVVTYIRQKYVAARGGHAEMVSSFFSRRANDVVLIPILVLLSILSLGFLSLIAIHDHSI